MTALYNEIEPYAAAWTRNLITAGHVAPGVVDERSIVDLTATDVSGPGQRHFFAGIGGWSHALRLAGVPDDADVWTGSCPCQPFSAAGGRRGFSDERHLWPAWFRLIDQCRPPIVLGEQVASPDGLRWLDAVFADLEGAGYACAAADLCAAGVGAPHRRQRLWFVAYANDVVNAAQERREGAAPTDDATRDRRATNRGKARVLGDPGRDGDRQHLGELPGDEGEHGIGSAHRDHAPVATGATHALADSADGQLPLAERRPEERDGHGSDGANHRASEDHSYWRDADWLSCRDGKWRPVEPGTFPLVDGVSNRVGRLRAYGNAIVPQVAATFIVAALDAIFDGGRR